MIRQLIASLSIFCLVTASAFADAWTDCGTRLIQDGVVAQKVSEMIGSDREKAAEVLQKKADDIRLLLLAKMFADDTGLCKNEIVEIAKFKELKLSFESNNIRYRFDIDVDKLFDYYETQTAIMVYNDRTKKIWDVIKSSDIKKSYWSKDCSARWISGNPSYKNKAVNQAGRKTFPEFGGDKNSFFLDFEDGNDKRAFPGFVIMDKSWSTKEEIVIFKHLPTAVKRTQTFADALQNSTCGNQGLAVYLVSIAGNPDKTGSTGHKGAGATIAGTGVGIGAVIIGSTAIASGTAIVGGIAYGTAGLLISAGLSLEAIPVVGWIVGTAAIVAGGIVALMPEAITKDITQVYVLDGPHIIR